jgi:Papain family cysteine protease
MVPRAGSTAYRRAPSLSRPAVDLRPALPAAIPAQGPRPTCVPFALTAAHEAIASFLRAQTAAYATEALWWHCHKLGQTSAQGVLLADVGAALVDSGQPELSLWPYDLTLGFGTVDPPPAAGLGPWETARLAWLQLQHDGIEDPLEDQLAAGYPVVLIVEVTPEFSNPDTEGHIGIPALTAAAGEYHAVVAVGAATESSKGRRLLIRNSWGAWWGLGGYGWLPLGYLRAFAVQAATVVAP